MTRTLALVAVFAALVPVSPLHAGGEGEGECPTACHGDLLTFCDDGEPAAIDCNDPEIIADSTGCGPLGGDFDCLLGSGAACDPDYAGGLSRCGANLFCVEGVCGEGPASPDSGPLQPSPGTHAGSATNPTANPFGCGGCGGEPSAAALTGATLLALRRRRR